MHMKSTLYSCTQYTALAHFISLVIGGGGMAKKDVLLGGHRTFWEIEMAKKYPVDFEAAARTPSSRASKRAPT